MRFAAYKKEDMMHPPITAAIMPANVPANIITSKIVEAMSIGMSSQRTLSKSNLAKRNIIANAAKTPAMM